MLKRPALVVRHMEPQRKYRKNGQEREEHFWYKDQHQREDRPFQTSRNSDPYSNEEDRGDDEYRTTHRYDNRRSVDNRGAFNGPHSHGKTDSIGTNNVMTKV